MCAWHLLSDADFVVLDVCERADEMLQWITKESARFREVRTIERTLTLRQAIQQASENSHIRVYLNSLDVNEARIRQKLAELLYVLKFGQTQQSITAKEVEALRQLLQSFCNSQSDGSIGCRGASLPPIPVFAKIVGQVFKEPLDFVSFAQTKDMTALRAKFPMAHFSPSC